MSTRDLADAATLPETPDLEGAYPRLGQAQLDTLEENGERRPIQPGEVLFVEGDRSESFYVVLAGRVAMVEAYGTDEQRVVRVHGPGRFLGQLSMLTGQTEFFTAVALQDGEVLVVPMAGLRVVVSRESALGDDILRPCLVRRTLAIGLGVGFRIVGSRYSQDTRRLRDFVMRNRLPHRFIDLEGDPTAENVLRQVGVGPSDTPVVVWRDQVLRNPSNAELAQLVGLAAATGSKSTCDLLVGGAGPAGLAAAVYGASEGLTTVVVDAGGYRRAGRDVLADRELPRIPGRNIRRRAGRSRGDPSEEVRGPHQCVRHRPEADPGRWPLPDPVCGRAGGVRPHGRAGHQCPLPQAAGTASGEFEKTSIYYAATPMEAQLCVNDPVVVVGGGNSAGQATTFLADHVGKIRLVVREHRLDEHMSRYLADRIQRDPRIEVLLHTEIRELLGDKSLEAVVVQDNESGEHRTLETSELFVFIGAAPCTDWLVGTLALDSGGYVLTGADAARVANGQCDELGRAPLMLETSAPGVFAVGDVRSGSIKRVTSAVGEGSMAVRLVHEHLATQGR